MSSQLTNMTVKINITIYESRKAMASCLRGYHRLFTTSLVVASFEIMSRSSTAYMTGDCVVKITRMR